MKPLFFRHSATIHTEFENVLQSAQAQGELHIGTPGKIEDRERGDGVYSYHRFYDATGKACEKYIGGPLGTPEADAARAKTQQDIDRAKMDVDAVKMFRKLGFACLDDKTGATLAALHNHGLFGAGLTLVGSHAYGAILNRLGVRAQTYLTEDIDVVRSYPLHLAAGANLELINVLKTSGLPFVKVPTGLRPGDTSVTHKLPGKERLMVDLLVSGAVTGKAVLVPELGVHAQSVQFLDYLVEDRMTSVAFSKNFVVPIYVPSPARFAVHKLFSCISRTNQFAKSEKDILQAAILICALEESYPDDVADAMNVFPDEGRVMMLKGASKAKLLIQGHSEQSGAALGDAIDALLG
ncbi:hypothetical protein LT85_0027 [Collimonas arenae]|uniref:Nucleotidyltransferase-like domain-containing protein n=1 Tax=Collimonas arenae TaxID=279058 RepID=A0A0A1F8J0_9BURK|nr:GSU2403 family nucleotidyltransferase fold protein [Collimonas arenae]AIY39187.1 hypothetical protein LT85_0027 [Collimonas arenae]